MRRNQLKQKLSTAVEQRNAYDFKRVLQEFCETANSLQYAQNFIVNMTCPGQIVRRMVAFKDCNCMARLRQNVCSGEARRPCANDYDFVAVF